MGENLGFSWNACVDTIVDYRDLANISTRNVLDEMFKQALNPAHYKKIIFNDPATIVVWVDGTKTVVKCCKNDKYDKMKGLALCFMKKFCEINDVSFHSVLKEAYDENEDA